MAFIKIFRSTKITADTAKRISEQLQIVQAKAAERTGCNRCIVFSDDRYYATAFSGTPDKPDLLLEIYPQKYSGTVKLYFNLFINSDEESFMEWDFRDIDECTDAVADRIAELMNRTVKFIVKQKKHAYRRIIEQVYSDNGTWTVINDFTIDDKLVRLFLTKDIDKETVVSFSI